MRPVNDSNYSIGVTSARYANAYFDTITIGDGVDSVLTSDAADTLALRNSTNAQAFNIYNTYTDASNYERLEVKWDTNVAIIGTASAGTGSNRDLELWSHGAKKLELETSTVKVYKDFYPFANGALSCGAANARWYSMYTKGLSTAVRTLTGSSESVGGNDNVALCDCTSNAITINLPAASTASGLQYHIKKIDSSSNTVTVDADGTETIDGALTQVISAQYESITIVCDGSNWHII